MEILPPLKKISNFLQNSYYRGSTLTSCTDIYFFFCSFQISEKFAPAYQIQLGSVAHFKGPIETTLKIFKLKMRKNFQFEVRVLQHF